MKKIVIAAVFALIPMGTLAQDLQKGSTAYDVGDYATALLEWQPLAQQGDADAQGNLWLHVWHRQWRPEGCR